MEDVSTPPATNIVDMPNLSSSSVKPFENALSDYELLRLANIKRNAEYLDNLGLGTSTNSLNIAEVSLDANQSKVAIRNRRKQKIGSLNDTADIAANSERRKSQRIMKISIETSYSPK